MSLSGDGGGLLDWVPDGATHAPVGGHPLYDWVESLGPLGKVGAELGFVQPPPEVRAAQRRLDWLGE